MPAITIKLIALEKNGAIVEASIHRIDGRSVISKTLVPGSTLEISEDDLVG